jgi:DNA-binding response OmpR family regulator
MRRDVGCVANRSGFDVGADPQQCAAGSAGYPECSVCDGDLKDGRGDRDPAGDSRCRGVDLDQLVAGRYTENAIVVRQGQRPTANVDAVDLPPSHILGRRDVRGRAGHDRHRDSHQDTPVSCHARTVTDGPVQEADETESPFRRATSDTWQNGCVRVLLIEDEARLSTAIARGLTVEGFDVDAVHRGDDGLWRATEFAYDAVVLDLLLPGLNGYQVCQQLRTRGIAVPILVLTAKIGEYDEAEVLDAGADDFLRKPFSYVVLAARLRALVRRRSGTGQVRGGDITLDVARRTCRRLGRDIALTERETSMLEVLLRADGEPVTKEALLELVWGAEFDGEPNIVEVYVLRLRRKLDEPFDTRSIRTVRGVGYQLLAPHE